ncbi:MAG TPA: lipase maturation factor family protein, partial [Candidatus Obscuribacterales bacterium]
MNAGNQIVTTHRCVQWLFLRALGLVYFIAFVSIGLQINGLIGSNGILPAQDYLRVLANYLPPDTRIFAVPTLAWYNSSDGFLQFLCWGGALAGLGVFLSIAVVPLLIVAWIFYLSLTNIGQDFLSFQWDILLLEAGFLAMFWSPWELLSAPWRKKLQLTPEPKTFIILLWLYRWLLFRLMFLSGSVKLLSGDPTWRHLTALKYHYFTQPLPTPLAWLMNQMPSWYQSVSVGAVFLIEMAVPFLFFFPRPFRVVAAALTVMLQLAILLTGNYTFFNLLTIALCIPLLDDALVKKVVPERLWARSVDDEAGSRPPLPTKGTAKIRRAATAIAAALVVVSTS